MKELMDKRFDIWSVIWILIIMVVEYIIGEIWDIGIVALLISVFLIVVILVCSELFHKKRMGEVVNKTVKEFVTESESIIREYGMPVLEEKDASKKVGKLDRIVLSVFKLNYYTRKLKDLVNFGDDKIIKLLTKSEKAWNSIKDDYSGKKQELEYIITESAKLTWLMMLIEENKKCDDFVFPLQYKVDEVTEEYTAEMLVEKQRKGQKTVFIADGGYGKTWTVERMARIYAERYVASFGEQSSAAFPVLVKVGDINGDSNNPVCDRMYEQLNEVLSLTLPENMKVAFDISASDILFIDALDEAKHNDINDAIVSEIKKYKNTVVFTTRPTDIACLNGLTDKKAENQIVKYYIADVDNEQVRKYLEKELFKKWKGVELSSEEVNTILGDFEKSGFREKCNSPFLLNCFISAIRDRMMDSKDIDLLNKKNLNELYGTFVIGIIKREREGKSLRGLVDVEEVLRYLNKFAIKLLEEGKRGLSGVEASAFAQEYFRDAAFDGRDLKNADKDINVSLREIHIFTVENGLYQFISDDFRDAVIKEEQIDEMLNDMISTARYNSGNLHVFALKFEKLFSKLEIDDVNDLLGVFFEREVSGEHALALVGESMYGANLNYIQENASEQDMYGLIKRLYRFEEDRVRMHTWYEKSCNRISEYMTAWLIGKTKTIKFTRQDEESEWGEFRFLVEPIQRFVDVKRQLFSLNNIGYIINSYGDNDYPKYLWLKERFSKYQDALERHKKNRRNPKYKYPNNLENVCNMIIESISSDFEFYDEVLAIKKQIGVK